MNIRYVGIVHIVTIITVYIHDQKRLYILNRRGKAMGILQVITILSLGIL